MQNWSKMNYILYTISRINFMAGSTAHHQKDKGYYKFFTFSINSITASDTMRSDKSNHTTRMQPYAVLVKIIKAYIILVTWKSV
jgi:hypothetical protein